MRFSELLPYADMLLSGWGVSIAVCLVSGVLGFGLAVSCAFVARSGMRVPAAAARLYIEVIRNTPFIVQLFFIYFGLAALGLRIGPVASAVVALSLNVGAYFAEIIRGGMEGEARGVAEAAEAQGMGRKQVFFRIALPIALAKIDRPLVGQFILVFLGSAVISQISVQDLTFAAQYIQGRAFRAFEAYFAITVMYAVTGLALSVGYAMVRDFLFPWQRAGAR